MYSREVLEQLSDRAGEAYSQGRGTATAVSQKQMRMVAEVEDELRRELHIKSHGVAAE